MVKGHRSLTAWRTQALLLSLAVVVLAAIPCRILAAQPSDVAPVSLDAQLYRLPSDDPSGRLLSVLRLTPAPG